MMPSLGSDGHLTKTCRPCHYIHTKAGCDNGSKCTFCHCKHSKRSRPRLSRAQRDQCKGLAQHVFDASDVQKPLAEAQLLAQTSSDPRLAAYATSVLRSLHGGAKLHIVRKVAAAETEQEKQFAEHFRKLIMDCSGEGDEEVSGPFFA